MPVSPSSLSHSALRPIAFKLDGLLEESLTCGLQSNMATHTERLLAGLGKLQEVLQGENAVGGGKEDLQKALDALNPFDALSSTQDQEMDLLFELFRVREAVMKIDCKVSTLDKVCNALIWTVMRAQNLDVPKKLGRVRYFFNWLSLMALSSRSSPVVDTSV